MKRLATPLLAVGLLLLGMWLNRPLFQAGEFPFRGSIEGGYAGTARFIAAHPNPWGWNPLQYGGLPTQFLYLPALPYATAALLAAAPHAAPETVYRLLASLLACLGPVTVFLFAVYFTGSRWWSLAAALAYTLVSPSYGLFPHVEKDQGIVQLPWRIQVLAKYGEGPHNAGLTLLPVALLLLWRAATGTGWRRILLAAPLLAAVALTNWVAALALAIASALLLLAGVGEPGFRAGRALAAAGIAYLLACFWLTPSFIRTIAFNWPADAFGYRFETRQQWLLAGLAGAVVALRLLFGWLRGSFYFRFVTMALLVFGWLATAYYVFGVDTIPESRRYALEFELFLMLAAAEAARLALRSANPTLRLCAVVGGGAMLLAGAPQVWAYVTGDRALWTPVEKERTVEHRLASWMAARQPRGRVFASGGLRFRLNSWFDVAQVGGGFESGLRNRMPVHLAYQVRTAKRLRAGREARDTVLMLKALGVEYIAVHGPKSKEYYRDYTNPGRLDGVLPVAFREGDDTIYQLPARPLAHLLRVEELPGDDSQNRPGALEAFVAAIDDPARPRLEMRWPDPGTITLDGAVAAGQFVEVQVSADPGWRATQDGRELEVKEDHLGFIVLMPLPAAKTHLELRYRGTGEQRVFAGVSVLAWLGWAAGLWVEKRRGRVS